MSRKLNGFSSLPQYLDGQLTIYEVGQTNDSYSVDFLVGIGVKTRYRDLVIYNKTRLDFEQQQREVTHMLRIPVFEARKDKRYVVIIDSVQYSVYSANKVTDSQGFVETELTCVAMKEVFTMESDL